MDKSICSFDGCEIKKHAKGLCGGHYRQQATGKPLTAIARGVTAEQRFWAKVEKTSTCWNWTGSKQKFGYGQFKVGNSNVKAYRYSYELLVGPIAAGRYIDHACHNPSCVNPDHLRVATPKQNSENLRGARRNTASGVRGVSKHPSGWAARVCHNKTSYHLGIFETIEEADEAVRAKRIELFTHNTMDRLKK